MQDEYLARQGYLLLADISGYTKFLTGSELEHAQAIIHELTTLVRERMVPRQWSSCSSRATPCSAAPTARCSGTGNASSS